MANLLTEKEQGRSWFIRTGVHCGGEHGQEGILSHIIMNHENSSGIIRAYCTNHGDLMATVEFPTHGSLEILMDFSFIHPLEAQENWSKTGPQFTLGNKISTLSTPVLHGVVYGFVTQMDGTSTVLIWSDADMYVQLRPDQIQLGHLASPVPAPSTPVTPLSAGTCLSGCTLLANASGGIPMT